MSTVKGKEMYYILENDHVLLLFDDTNNIPCILEKSREVLAAK
jgi:hypothetical protein